MPSYEEVLLSGYTDGYEDGYGSYVCYKNMYFTIEAMEAGNIPVSSGATWRVNKGEWQGPFETGTMVPVEVGDKIEISRVRNTADSMFRYKTGMPRYKAYGNAMSLVWGDDFRGKTAFPSQGGSGAMVALFESTKIVYADNLVLPATDVPTGGYEYMFNNCSLLVAAPELPATGMSQSCYFSMFQGCTSLVDAPELPATNLAPECYREMFYGCTSLETAPELPATTLTDHGYATMFGNCSSLKKAPELPATTLDENCYRFMFQNCTSLTDGPSSIPASTIPRNACTSMFVGCTSLTKAPALPATTMGNSCYAFMFNGCTSLVNAPALPATTMAQYCFNGMFSGCTSLENAQFTIPATTMVNNCCESMFFGCTALVNAPVLQATTLGDNCYKNMFKGCTSLVNAPALQATTLATGCYYGMFARCSQLTVVQSVLPAMTLASGCYDSMFDNCTSLVTAPELPAETLVDTCYEYMFNKCSSLNYVKVLATNISASMATTNWLRNVAPTGTFIHPCGVDWAKNSNSGIPSGWTEVDDCPPLESRFNAVYNVGANNLVKIFGDSGATAFSKVELEDGTDITSQINNGWYTASQSGQIRVFLTPANTGETEVFAYAFGKNEPYIPHSGGANLYSVVIPDGYTSIGEGAFEGCNDLSEVVLPGGITTVKSKGFCCCYDLDIELPNTLTEIGRYGFAYCTSITSLTIPSGVTYIESLSFECIGVREIVVPATVTVVDSGAFSSCENLTSVTIGNNVRYVGDGAFLNCSGITEMIFERTSPPMIGSTTPLGQTEYTFPIYVPDASVDAYKEHMDWVDYASRVKGISERQ